MNYTLDKILDEYSEQGYIHLRNKLSKHDLLSLENLCSSIVTNDKLLESSDLSNAHINFNKKINRYFPRTHTPSKLFEIINSIIKNSDLEPFINRLCNNHIEIDPDFTILSWLPDDIKKGFTGYHQDGPESSIKEGFPHIWIPITDTEDDNLSLIPNTHKLGNLPHTMFGQYIKVKPEYVSRLDEDEIDIKVDVGDIFIFSTRILHCLRLNKSNNTFWSLEFICTPKIT